MTGGNKSVQDVYSADRKANPSTKIYTLSPETFILTRLVAPGPQLPPLSSFKGTEPKDRDISNPVVQRNADGHLEVFAPGNGAFCNRWQEQPLTLTVIHWRHEGWNAKPKPKPEVGLIWIEAAINVGGQLNNHLEVFGLGDDGALWHTWQIDQAPFWSAWESLGAPPPKIREADRLTVGTHQDGRLEVFLAGEDGAVWHTSQIR